VVDELKQQDNASRVAYAWAERSFEFRRGLAGQPIASQVAQFSSWLDTGANKIAVSSDGIGTKVEIAERLGEFGTLGYDLMAMVTDDLAANGVEPFALTNTLDVNRLDHACIDALMHGLHDAAKVARVCVIGGEIAELGARVQGYGAGMHLNWCATAIGLLRAGWAPIDGSDIQLGDAVLAIESQSFRSNGYSTLRAGLTRQYGNEWHTHEWANRSWGAWLLEPCRIYSPLIVALRTAGFQLNGLAHITGGGIPNKLARTLAANKLGAELHDLIEAPAFMNQARELCSISMQDAYRHWNMGNGFILVVPAVQTTATLDACLAQGYSAKHVGNIIAEPVIQLKPNRSAASIAYQL
jgi:phosphoribosylformylglycinamidine cyclo-ligase